MKIEYVPVRFEDRTDLYVFWKNYQANKQSGLK
ncbi:nucleoside deaminase, partial [Acinetobacter baumannii]